MRWTIHKVMLSAVLPVAAAALAMALLSWSGGTQKVHAATDPSVEFSISAPGCNSNGIPTTTCNVTVSTQFTLAFNIDALPSNGSYIGYDALLTYTSGLTTSLAGLTIQGAGNWPDCNGAGGGSSNAGWVEADCGAKTGTAGSTYLGALFHLKFTCSSTPSTQTITLVPGDGNTHTVDSGLARHSEATNDINQLTIICQAAPPPSVSVGGITDFPASPDGGGSYSVVIVLASVAALAVSGAAATYARKHRSR